MNFRDIDNEQNDYVPDDMGISKTGAVTTMSKALTNDEISDKLMGLHIGKAAVRVGKYTVYHSAIGSYRVVERKPVTVCVCTTFDEVQRFLTGVPDAV